jgi:ribulose-5-phosphate 4-epimerase/fuculose-1-phosphate aldolase
MTFSTSVDHLLPPLTRSAEVVLLARTLWREGYDDHLAGHITYRLEDGTFLTNPWFLLWNEFGPDDVIRIDIDGNVLEGRWPAAPGVKLHLALHRARADVVVAVHNHPHWATVYANLRRIPGCYDQSSALGGGAMVVVDQYTGGVDDPDNADLAVEAMGDADIALLAGHGVFVLGDSVREVHQRAVALEQRAHRAWFIEHAGGSTVIPASVQDTLGRAEFFGFWEAMARRELLDDPDLRQAIAEAARREHGGTPVQ